MDDVGDSRQNIFYYSLVIAPEIIAKAKQQRTFKRPKTNSCYTFNRHILKITDIINSRYKKKH